MRSHLVSAGLLSSALLLSGCGTGLQATTYTKERSPRDFAGASLQGLEVRNLGIAPPATGGTLETSDTAVLTGSVVNTGTTDDTLVGVETDIAATATLTPGTSTNDGTTPGAIPSPSPAGQSASGVPVPAGGDASDWSVQLTGLRAPLHVGQYVTVTLVFAQAGRLADLQVPVRAGDTGLSDRTPAQDPYKSAE